MKRVGIIIAIMILLAGCQSESAVNMDKMLNPVTKDDKVPTLPTPKEAVIPYAPNDVWASDLSKYVPVYENPEFLPVSQLGKPEIFQNTLSSVATDINAQTFHKASPRDVFEWFDKNYQRYSYKLDANAGRDPKVYIVVDEHGYYLLTDGTKSMEIQIWSLSAYPGWTKVTYQGTVNKDCGCEKKQQ